MKISEQARRELVEPVIDRAAARVREHLPENPSPGLLDAIRAGFEDAIELGAELVGLELVRQAAAHRSGRWRRGDQDGERQWPDRGPDVP
jgi:hypothetical protein